MKIWEDMLRRLRNGESPEEVRKDYRSDSQFAKAVRIYNDECSKETEEKRKARVQEEEKLNEAMAQRDTVKAEKDGFNKSEEDLRGEKETLSAEVQSLRKENDELKANVEALEKKGYTPDVIETLKISWTRNGAEAIAIMLDHEKAVKLQETIQQLSNEEAKLNRSICLLSRKQQDITRELDSEHNRLDSIRAEASASQKAISVVESAF